MKKKLIKIDTGRGYAWECDFGLCHWAEPTVAQLKRSPKPSPEAKPVATRIIRESDYRKMLKVVRNAS
jgi:hypothetical protein